MSGRCATVLLLLLGGCFGRQPSPWVPPVEAHVEQAKPTGGDAASRQRQQHARRMLSMVPASAEGLMILDFARLFEMLEQLQGILAQTREGRRYLSLTRALAGSGPVPAPWTTRELERLGLDATRPALVYAERREVAVLPVSDPMAVKTHLATLITGRPWATWREELYQGLRIQALRRGHYRRAACRQDQRYMTCSRRKKQLLRAVKRVPYRSRWVTLNHQEREDLARATAMVFFSEGGFGGKGLVRVEDEGLSAQLELASARLTRLLGPPPESPPVLLGLAQQKSRTMIYARAHLGALLDAADGLRVALQRAGLAPARLRRGLSGELLFVDAAPQHKALLLGCTDRALTRKLVELVVRGLGSLPQRLRGVQLPSVKATRVGPAQGGGYRLRLTLQGRLLRLDWRLRLAAARTGLVLGTEAAVRELLERPVVPPRVAREGELLGPRTQLLLRGLLRDPDQMAPVEIAWEQVQQLGGSQPWVAELVVLGRFLLDQLDRVKLGVQRPHRDRLRVVARITTLHRGIAADDQPRRLWLGALKARRRGHHAAQQKLLRQLRRRFPASLHARRLRRKARDLDASGAALGLLAGVAIPDLLRHQTRKYTAEATDNLDKIKAGARSYFIADHYDKNGNLLPKRFPASMAVTPAGGPPAGSTTSTSAAQWDRQGWNKLHFKITAPHRYAYTFDSSGINTKAVYTARAVGDLDGDGVLSTFEMRGSVDKQFSVHVVGPIIHNELE